MSLSPSFETKMSRLTLRGWPHARFVGHLAWPSPRMSYFWQSETFQSSWSGRFRVVERSYLIKTMRWTAAAVPVEIRTR